MDALKSYLKSLADEAERAALAERCGTSLGHLRNITYGKRCSAPLAAKLEQETGGAVRRWDMRPDWRVIWPELIDSDGAPAEPAEAA